MRYGLIERLDDGTEEVLTVSYEVADGQVQPHRGQALNFEAEGVARQMRVVEVAERPDIADVPFVIVEPI